MADRACSVSQFELTLSNNGRAKTAKKKKGNNTHGRIWCCNAVTADYFWEKMQANVNKKGKTVRQQGLNVLTAEHERYTVSTPAAMLHWVI